MSEDEFTLIGSYSPSTFYVSSGGRGSGTTIRAQVPEGIMEDIRALVQQRRIPQYRTYGDFVRDAVIHRLHWVTENYPEGESNLTAVNVAQERLQAIATQFASLAKPKLDFSQLEVRTNDQQSIAMMLDLCEEMIEMVTDTDDSNRLQSIHRDLVSRLR